MVIHSLHPADWPAVRRIYAEGIATGNATFEQAAPDWDEWDAGKLAHPRLAAEVGGALVGWAALSPTSKRSVYRGVAEVSVYVDASVWGQGVGRALLSALVEQSEAAGIWTLQAGIFPENGASVHLHERCGFRIVGRREKIGQMRGVWRDVLLMERRSRIVDWLSS
ncbi:MAG: N-acetyltransferase family protein [Chloroflexi bacterium]|nr:MAG: N-acetyltransferase family protein [Chloroflexota bacterium]